MTIVSNPATTTSSVAQTVGNPDANIGVIGVAPVIAVGNADALVGFYGATPVAKATVTGARDDGTALLSLLTALADLGLIVDSTTAT